MYEEQNIRFPDETKQDQLLEDNRSQYQKDIDEVLYLSKKELDDDNTKSSNYERLIIEEYNAETKKRHDILAPILFEIIKVSKFDKDIKTMYHIIKPIIDSYCNMSIDTYTFDELTYHFIFKHICLLRICNLNIHLLKTIFVI